MTTLVANDLIEGQTSGFTARVVDVFTTLTSDPMEYNAVLDTIIGTPTLAEYLLINGVLSTYQVNGALVAGCTGVQTSGL